MKPARDATSVIARARSSTSRSCSGTRFAYKWLSSSTKTPTISSALYSNRTDEWPTPRSCFNELNAEFKFTLDPCASEANTTCATFFTKKDNGLIQDLENHRVFCNPPYDTFF
ncbi:MULTISPECIES: DNA N-6-adenine-methyltransferase [Bradyrhizobium]|uniref:DNA N-6-adenine-methyltransferase n=1 Tax=Bradyrhizobium TaxID=374 RepID=UPI003C752073